MGGGWGWGGGVSVIVILNFGWVNRGRGSAEKTLWGWSGYKKYAKNALGTPWSAINTSGFWWVISKSVWFVFVTVQQGQAVLCVYMTVSKYKSMLACLNCLFPGCRCWRHCCSGLSKPKDWLFVSLQLFLPFSIFPLHSWAGIPLRSFDRRHSLRFLRNRSFSHEIACTAACFCWKGHVGSGQSRFDWPYEA